MKQLLVLCTIGLSLFLMNCGSDDSTTDIVVDPVTINFSEASLSLDENIGMKTVTIVFGDVAPVDATINLSFGGTATYEADYSTIPDGSSGSTTLAISEGDESITVTLNIVNDEIIEGDETIVLSISIDEGVEGVELGSSSELIITILDSPIDPVTVDFSSVSADLSESIGQQTINLVFSDALAIDSDFNISLGGTATYNDDFTTTPAAVSGAISVGALQNETATSFDLTIIDDVIDEEDETITLTISIDPDEQGIESGNTIEITLTISDDDGEVLVAIRRQKGELIAIDLTDNSQTKLLDLTIPEGGVLKGSRGFVYDALSGKGYVSQSNNAGSKLYSVDMSTGLATILNDNTDPDFEWDSMADLAIENNSIVASGWYRELTGTTTMSGHGIGYVNMSDGSIMDYFFLSDANRGAGLALGSTSDFLYYGDQGAIQKVDLVTTVGMVTTIPFSSIDLTSFTNVYVDFTLSSASIQNMAESSDGTVYAIVYDGGYDIGLDDGGVDSDYQFLVSIDIETGEITFITTLMNNDKTNSINALAFIPEGLF